ncbi:MAG: hypothetical protein Q9212_004371 [Teloschistes hypoglaucus]
MLEPTGTQATGKAFGLENIIAQLETMATTTTAGGMADVTLTYTLGESHDLWNQTIFIPSSIRGERAWLALFAEDFQQSSVSTTDLTVDYARG